MSAFPPITELVPHGVPMLAVEELLEWEDGFARARLRVDPESSFLVDGRLDTVVTLEYMAQTVAACLGMESRAAGGAVRMGMVIACPEMTIERPFLAPGEELVLEARRVRGTDLASQFEASVVDGRGEGVARARLTLVHGEAPPE